MAGKPFQNAFLNQFLLSQEILPFSDFELKNLDNNLKEYDQLFLDPAIEKNLISKNELLTSFAISKAENSSLTLTEAHEVYQLIVNNPDYTFITKKITTHQLTRKEYEKLEFLNIVKTVRHSNQNIPELSAITPEYIKNLHKQLTQGLDVFQPYLHGFTVYKSGHWRDNDDIRVGSYMPAHYDEIADCLKELLQWLHGNQTITCIGIFHTALYAIHPFNNGNKRVARVLEHILLRSIDINSKNLYSTSYYYHQEKERYYKYLLYSLEKKNLTYFVSFFQEAIALSILTVIQSSIETQRSQFVRNATKNDKIQLILRQLIKRRELQFKTLLKIVQKKMARQTFVTHLQEATDQGFIKRREAGRSVYYSLNISLKEEVAFDVLLQSVKPKLSYIPDFIKLS